ncbi:MAG: hypothetical protein AAGK05_12350, partial [Pseudomonadota bacterium]
NNPMPSGTAVAISADNGDYSGTSGFDIGNTSRTTATGVALTISREADPNDKTDGFLTVEFTTGKDNVSTATIAISDDG